MSTEETKPTNEIKRRNLIKETIFGTCVDTSTHAIPNILKNSSHSALKTIWILCLLVCTVVCLIFIIQSIQLYVSFSTYVTTSIVDNIPANFPAVSFCNMKLVNSSTPLGASLTNSSTFSNKFYTLQLDTWFKIQTNLLSELLQNASLNELTRKSAGFLIENMLVSCSFNAFQCNSSDFTYFFHQNYGNCYTFNAHNNQVKTSYFDGSINGLILELFIGKPSVNTQNVNHDGVVLSIHNQTQEPFYQGSITPVAANTETYLSVKRNFITKLESPYGNCLNDTSSTQFYNYIVNKINRSYSKELCLKICTQYQLIQECGCQSFLYIFYQDTSAGYCKNSQQLTCLRNFINNYTLALDSCKTSCSYECNTVEYEISSFNALYPTSFYTNTLYDYSKAKGFNLSLSEIPQAFVKLFIYYDSLKYTATVQTAQLQMSDLMANIGGNLGLFLGMSFLTIAELIEISFNTIFILITSRKNRKIEANEKQSEIPSRETENPKNLVMENIFMD